MHFEILVEDQSGKRALDILIPKIIAGSHTFKIIDFRGIGHIPQVFKQAAPISGHVCCSTSFLRC